LTGCAGTDKRIDDRGALALVTLSDVWASILIGRS